MDLHKEIGRVINLFSVQAAAKGVEVALDLSDDLPRMVVGDAVRISQVFSNLVSNAGKLSISRTSHHVLQIKGV